MANVEEDLPTSRVNGNFVDALLPTQNLVLSGLKWAAQRTPMLLAAARATRKLFCGNPKLRPGFAPLRVEEALLAELAAISPNLRDEVLTEFAAVARRLGGVPPGLTTDLHKLAEIPLENLLPWAADLNIVYAPLKVGGNTLAATVQRHPSVQHPVLHRHFLSSTGLEFAERLMNRCAKRPSVAATWRDNVLLGHWARTQLAINRALRAQRGPLAVNVRKPFIITCVREPVALHLSLVFQISSVYMDDADELTTEFVHERLTDDACQHHCGNWLSNELAMMFGIDVYAQPFPRERGWDIYENDDARVLLIRLESLAGLPNALGALYGLNPCTFTVVSANLTESKSYAARYDAVKKKLRLSRQELEEIYSQPYVRHFYTRKEIAAFKSRWQAAEQARRAA